VRERVMEPSWREQGEAGVEVPENTSESAMEQAKDGWWSRRKERAGKMESRIKTGTNAEGGG
jgi:hypothetical protein